MCPVVDIQSENQAPVIEYSVIRTSIAHVLMAFFAMFPTVFKTYEMCYVGFHSKQGYLSKDIFTSKI